MNNTNHRALVQYRTMAEIDLHDLAYIFNIDRGQFTKIEKGIIPPTLEMVILYHMLFGVPIEDIVPEKFAEIYSQSINKCRARIAFLKKGTHPKSVYRIKSIERVVKYLNRDYDY